MTKLDYERNSPPDRAARGRAWKLRGWLVASLSLPPFLALVLVARPGATCPLLFCWVVASMICVRLYVLHRERREDASS